MKQMYHILFVCTQNVFRSFSAQKLLEKYLAIKQDTRFIVSSAGTQAYPDKPYSYTIQKLKELKVLNLDHQQTRVSQKVLDKQDIIICMTKEHQNFLKQNFNKKSYLYNELAFQEKTDLQDDVETNCYLDSSLESFVKNTVVRINEGIPALYRKLLELNNLV